MMLDKNQIRSVSFQFIKQQKQHTTSARLAQELITNIQCSGASRSFATEVRALKVQEHSGLPLGGDKGRLRGSSKLVLLKLQKVLLKNSMMTIQHLKQIGKVKKLDRWVPHDWTASQKKKIISKCRLLILCSDSEPFLNWIVMCDKKWILYDSQWWRAQWLNQEAAKHFQKPNLHPKRSWSLFGDLLLNFGDLEFSESWQNHYIWEVCSANWWDAPKTEHTCRQHRSTERVPFFSMTTPGHMMYNQRFKSWTNWSVKFCLICHTHLTSRQLTTTSSNTSTGHRMVSKNSSNPEAWIFTL